MDQDDEPRWIENAGWWIGWAIIIGPPVAALVLRLLYISSFGRSP